MIDKNYVFNPDFGIWQKKGKHDFAYSDGARVEQALWAILASVSDKSVNSKELAKYQTDWVTTYYFSPKRANLLRPFARLFQPAGKVLELGCGCGAISRYLAESGCELCAVDGSARRASIAALRCSGLNNVTLVVDDIFALPQLGKFDVVTLIGVLEYACKYGGSDAALKLLQRARSFLVPGGALILALENRLGLKYFAGIPEDHTGRPWDGVTDAYQKDGVKTYSRKELVGMIRDAGFTHIEQYIPVPDYKLPVMVITPEGIARSVEENVFAGYLGKYRREFERDPVFDMKGAWRSVVKAGLIHEMADSFLFLASDQKLGMPCDDRNKFIQKYA